MKIYKLLFIGLVILSFTFCAPKNEPQELKVRNIVDTIGFVQYDWQMDSIIQRLNVSDYANKSWRVAISPHDDYAYVKNMYPNVLSGIKAKTVILFGVAHKAKNYDLEDKLVFDSFDAWSAPYGNVKTSELRNQIIKELGDSLCIIHDEMHKVEHSLEALIPFLQYNNRDIEVIPILVPYMSFDTMRRIAKPLAKILSKIMVEKDLQWGSEIAIVISTDAVHYGDEDWGGKNYAPFGVDSLGLVQAKNHELEIISQCLLDEISIEKIQRFINYTVQETDYREYKWSWCGRYSVPFGLMLSHELEKSNNFRKLEGQFIGYSNSIDGEILKVTDINMGTTAPANNRHWVGYAAVGYE